MATNHDGGTATMESGTRGATRHNRNAVDVTVVQDVLKRRRVEQTQGLGLQGSQDLAQASAAGYRQCVWEASEAGRCISAVVDSAGGFTVTGVPLAGLISREANGQLGEETIHGTILRGLGLGSSDDPLLCVRGPYKKPTRLWTNMFWWVPQGRTGMGQCLGVHQCQQMRGTKHLNSAAGEGRRIGGRRSVAGKSLVPTELMQELAEAYLWRVGGSMQAAVGVNVADVSSGVVGKREDRAEGADLSNARASWEILPPRNRAGKRSATDRVAGLSTNAKRWVGMVHKGRKRAAAPANSQKKKMKKGYMDCWDFLDTVDGSSVPVRDELRNASTTERD